MNVCLACANLIAKSEAEILELALETMGGHQRAIIGSLSIREIHQDRNAFCKAVFEAGAVDLATIGLTVVSYTLKLLSAGYMQHLGIGQTAKIKKDARIGIANATMKVNITQHNANQQRMMSM